MSLVEKAIRKIQEQRVAAGAPVGSTGPAAPAHHESAHQSLLRDRPPAVSLEKVSMRAAGLLPPAEEEQRLAQQYRRIKRPLVDHAIGRGAPPLPKGYLIMVASALPGEGKSFTSVNLALSLALEKDLNVLLVDADIPKPQLTRVFGLEGERGLLDLLRDPQLDVESIIRSTDVPTLSFLPTGVSSAEATELLSSKRMEEVSALLGQPNSRRIVVFDTPPLLQTSESPALMHGAGQIVVVVRAESTPQPVVLDALKSLKGHPSVSLVLNQCRHASTAAYYYYGSGGRPERSVSA